MYELYRVLVCKNEQKYPGKLFIDIYPAEFVTHEKLLKMRQFITPDVYEITGGVYLKNKGNDGVSLQYVKHYNKFLQMQQGQLRQKIDHKILKMFDIMQKIGIKQTIKASVFDAVEVFSWDICRQTKIPESAKEESFLLKQKYMHERLSRLEQKRACYAQQKYAANPQLVLQWKQAMYRGD